MLNINKILKFASYFNKLAQSKLEELISKYPEDIANHLRSIENDSVRGRLIGAFRSNPNLSLEELKALTAPDTEKKDLNSDDEKSYVNVVTRNMENPGPFKFWALKQLRLIRQRKDYNNLSEEQKQYYRNIRGSLSLIADWYKSENPNIESYSADAAMAAQTEWHKYVAGEGEGKRYDPINPALIQYGPQWKNSEFNGHFIIEITSENDLLTEGNIMDNCVGGNDVIRNVERGNFRVFSLRTADNKPLVSIGTKPDMRNFERNYLLGHSNADPSSTQKAMIKEWVEEKLSEKGPPTYECDVGSENVFEANVRDLAEEIDNLDKPNEYGMNELSSISYINLYRDILRKISNRDGEMSPYGREIARSLAHKLLESAVRESSPLWRPSATRSPSEAYLKWGNLPGILFMMDDDFQKADEKLFNYQHFPSAKELNIDRGDFETEEAYDAAVEEARNEWEIQDRDEQYLKYMPFAFIIAFRNAIREFLPNFKDKLPPEIFKYIEEH